MARTQYQRIVSPQFGNRLMKIASLFLLLPSLLLCGPKGAQVSQGHAHVAHHGSETQIETSHHAVINWDSFSIASGETTRFVQPHTNSAVINRVSEGASQIDGALIGNGRIYLLNPNGVLVGKSGIISCAAFAASTLDFDSDACFKGGDLLFKGKSQEKIINCGKIEALHGDVFLLARVVVNEGAITAKEGVVGLAAASEVLLKPEGVQRLYIAPQEEEGALLENGGVIESARAELRADGNVYRLAINQSGVVEATGFREEGGQIILTAEGGEVEHSGRLIAKSGTVHVLGGDVYVEEGAHIDVSSAQGGGEILIGGSFQGSDPDILNARHTVVKQDTLIDARASEDGEGGKVIIWGDEIASFEGKIDARGGTLGGDGGFVEVSSPGFLDFNGLVDLSAERGEFGNLLLDPSDITVSISANASITFDASGRVYSATASTANLNRTTLVDALNAGNVTVTTSSSFSQPGDITLEREVDWAAATTLTLIADRDVIANGSGDLIANGGSIVVRAGRDFNVPQGVVFSANSGSIAISAARDIDLRSVNSVFEFDGITVSLDAGRNFSMTALALTADMNVDAGTGGIRINQASSAGSGDVILGSTSGQALISFVSTGQILLECEGDLQVLAGIQPATGILVFSESGVSRFSVGGNLLVQGGAGDDCFASLGTTVGQLEFDVGGNVEVLGGSGSRAHAQLGHFRRSTTEVGSGDLIFREIGGDVRVIGGSGTDSFAHIGSSADNAAATWNFQGDVLLEDIRGGVEVRSGTASAVIGYGDSPSSDSYTGSLRVHAQKDVVVTASDALATIGIAPGGGNTLSGTLSELSVRGQNITLNAGNGQDATLGFQSNGVSPTSTVSIQKMNIEALGTIELNPGINTLNFNGSSLIGTFTIDGSVSSSVAISAGNVVLNGSSEVDGGYSRIISTRFASPTDIEIRTKNIDVGFTGTNPGTAELFAGGNLLVLAEDNVTLRQPSSICTDAGDITLVADFNESDPLEIGDGNFSIFSGASLISAGALRIFTPKRENIVVEAPLNGAVYLPGPLYVDTPSEQWGSAYPDDFGGFPFTVFYKSALSSTLYNQINQIFGEMFQKLSMYDELLFSCKCFLFGYDKACYDQLFHPKGMVSSFDLFSEEEKSMLRQKYRNYELKYVESF